MSPYRKKNDIIVKPIHIFVATHRISNSAMKIIIETHDHIGMYGCDYEFFANFFYKGQPF